MPLIEGLGDEVTLIVGGFCICIVLMLAWFSTHTSDIPLLREVGVIVVELSQRRSRHRNNVDNGERTGEETTRTDETGPGEQEPTVTLGQGQGNENSSLLGGNSDTQDREITESGSWSDNVPAGRFDATKEGPALSLSASGPSRVKDGNSLLPASNNFLPEAAEATTREANQDDLNPQMSLSPECDEAMPPSHEADVRESSVPTASVTVEENQGYIYSVGAGQPTEEELRRRRVQYFLTLGSAQTQELGSTGGNTSERYSQGRSEASSLSKENIGAKIACTEGYQTSQKFNSASESVDSSAGVSHESTTDTSIETSCSNSSSATDSGDSTPQSQNLHDPTSVNDNGQAEASGSSRIRVKLKYMNETQRFVYASPFDTIGDFRRNHFQSELEEDKWVRFIYNGQDLRDDARTLQACNIGDNCTMHCLITSRSTSARDAGNEEEEDSFVGALMYPLFTIILLIVWYFRFIYRQYFSAMSTVCLIGISFLLGLSYISSLRTPDRSAPVLPQRDRQGGSGGTAQQQQQQNPEHQHAD